MEGGLRGLVVVTSAFFVQVLVFGTSSSLGVYTVALVEYFDGDVVGVSLITAIYYAMFLCTGPIVSSMMSWVTHRKLALVGSLLVVLGDFCSPFIPSLTSLYIFFGILSGLGRCMVYVPSHSLCSFYYQRHRALATCIVCAGSGVGGMVLPVLIEALIQEYTWRGSLIIQAGLDLHLFVLSLLLVPPENNEKTPLIKKSKEDLDLSPSQSSQASSPSDGRDRHLLTTGTTGDIISDPLERELDLSADYGALDRMSASKEKAGSETVILDEDNDDEEHLDHAIEDKLLNDQNMEVSDTFKQNGTIAGSETITDKESGQALSDFDQNKDKYLCILYSSKSGDGNNSPNEDDPCIEIVCENNQTNCILMENLTERSKPKNEQLSPSDNPNKKLKTRFRQLLDSHLALFQNFGFVLFFVSTMLFSLTSTVFYTFGPELVVEKGFHSSTAAFFFMFVGIGSLAGNLIISAISHFVTNPTLLLILGNLILGVTLSLLPIASAYTPLIILHVTLGMSQGFLYGLSVVMVIETIGVAYVELGLGHALLACGIGSFVGPPVFGDMRENYNNYILVFYVNGGLSLVAGLLMVPFLMSKYVKKRSNRSQQTTT